MKDMDLRTSAGVQEGSKLTGTKILGRVLSEIRPMVAFQNDSGEFQGFLNA